MSDEKLKQTLKPFIDDVQSDAISDYTCIKKHVELLLKVRASGVTVKAIVEISGISYSRSMFSNKLSQFKRGLGIEIRKEPIAEKDFDLKPISQSSCKAPDAVNKITSGNDSSELKYSLSEWSSATRFGDNGIKTYMKAEAVGLCPSDFNGLMNYDRINIIQIISGWTKTVNNVLIEDDQKPNKEQFLAKYKG